MKFAGDSVFRASSQSGQCESEQELENLLQLLWRTRKSGLSAPQKSSFQSLLNLPSPAELDPKHERRWKDELSKEQGVVPRLESMTWTVDNNRRVAIITLKLQDYTKSPLNQNEVKFQLTRDTLDAVLRSMAYIHQQLSGSCHYRRSKDDRRSSSNFRCCRDKRIFVI